MLGTGDTMASDAMTSDELTSDELTSDELTTTTRTGDESMLQEAVRRLVAALRPERIYLFGSQARGDATEDSDYDFMIIVRGPHVPSRELAYQARGALAGLGIAKDVVVMPRERFEWLRSAKASLPATVEREGRLLYAA
jgi:hypothetical protein